MDESAALSTAHNTSSSALPEGRYLRLRPKLEETERIQSAFRTSEDRISVADVDVPAYDIELRLAKIRRALIAHAAVNRLLARVGITNSPTKMIDAIHKGEDLGVVDVEEGKWLRHFNKAANEAKHELAVEA